MHVLLVWACTHTYNVRVTQLYQSRYACNNIVHRLAYYVYLHTYIATWYVYVHTQATSTHICAHTCVCALTLAYTHTLVHRRMYAQTPLYLGLLVCTTLIVCLLLVCHGGYSEGWLQRLSALSCLVCTTCIGVWWLGFRLIYSQDQLDWVLLKTKSAAGLKSQPCTTAGQAAVVVAVQQSVSHKADSCS